MRRVLALPLLFSVLLLWSSCRVIHHDYRGDKQITPGTVLTQPSQRLGGIRGQRKALFLLFGWIPLNNGSGAELADDLARAVYGDAFDGITHVKIKDEWDPLDCIVNSLVGILFSMVTVEVEGEVHKFSSR